MGPHGFPLRGRHNVFWRRHGKRNRSIPACDGDDETDAEEVEDMAKDDIRQCTRDLLLVEWARELLLDEGK